MNKDKVQRDLDVIFSQKSEGAWWDFKEKHHKDNGNLIHDILCLSNAVTGTDKYLIFGVTDTFTAKGISEKEKVLQSNIMDLVQKLPFSGDRPPNISFQYIDIEGVNIGVLSIKDEPNKPYYLTKDYSRNCRRVPKGVVFTRNECRNTPIDSCAKDHEVELMWKERLGVVVNSKLLWAGVASLTELTTIAISGFSEMKVRFFNERSEVTTYISIDLEGLRNIDDLKVLVENEPVSISLVQEYYKSEYSIIKFSGEQRGLKIQKIVGVS